jgi:hypothetical protein
LPFLEALRHLDEVVLPPDVVLDEDLVFQLRSCRQQGAGGRLGQRPFRSPPASTDPSCLPIGAGAELGFQAAGSAVSGNPYCAIRTSAHQKEAFQFLN